MRRVYFDNASTTAIDPRVQNVMIDIIENQYGNPSSIHFHGRHSRSIVEDARKTVAQSIKASVGEIFFTSSATEANNMILKNCVEYLNIKRIISSPVEHHCVLNSLAYLQQQKGIEIIYLDVDKKGNINLEQLRGIAQAAPTLVSLMWGNNEIGTLTDITNVSEICKNKNWLFHTDAVQAIGKYPLDVSETYISFLSGTAHKIHGPKGSAFFYMNQDCIIPPFIHGGAQERNMRAGTENVIGIAGLAKALEITNNERDLIIEHTGQLKKYFLDRITHVLHDVRVNGNVDNFSLHHILSLSFPPTDKADMLMFNLDINGISVSSGSACSSGIETDSHVLQAIGHPNDRKTLRFSFSKFNTIEEVDHVVNQLLNLTPTKEIVS